MTQRANMIIVKIDGDLHEWVITGDGTIMGDSNPFTSDAYEELEESDISLVSYENYNSTEILRYSIADDEKPLADGSGFEKVSISKVLEDGKLQEFVYALVKNIETGEVVRLE